MLVWLFVSCDIWSGVSAFIDSLVVSDELCLIPAVHSLY